jgi:hypothetical protein
VPHGQLNGLAERAGVTSMSQEQTFAAYLPLRPDNQLTPSFFCRLDEDVVYWNTSRLSG